MAVSYAQFLVEYPEFSEVDQTLVEPRLTAWDSFLNGFGEFHDRAVYTRTALDLSETVFSMPMAPAEGGMDKYARAWDRMLKLSFRRGQISGGGLT